MPVWPVHSAIGAFIRIGVPDRYTSRRVEQQKRRESPPIDPKPRAEHAEFGAARRVVGAATLNRRASTCNSHAVTGDSAADTKA